ncbi:hypothetical protein C2E21_3503 [Chlorella sorokiniana]|uniref:Uncharacterized protein n=1 Tax=Chlorella sorokiniana TaxID=3076 RepID=A0A2P6TVD0_CHLSO|nr:hypothetical protein C2E21_3503 [Chlorella sorokiniana]|eukprot:PRW57996.1 hypothetical protein C2E21_3503 [Chlorella sorokiniana]
MAPIVPLSQRQLAPFSPLLGSRPALPGRRVSRGRLRISAFWPGQSGKSDSDYTDDEILTAAAVSKPVSGGPGSRRSQAKQAAAAPTGAGEEVPPGQPTLFKFAAAFTFVTLSAFFIGAAAGQESEALRLLLPMPGGGEQHCAALFQDEADGKAAQAALQRVAGLGTSLRQRPAAGLLADTACSGWGAAFYPAGSLQGALVAVQDAAAQQEQLARGGSGRQAGPGGSGEAGSEEDYAPDAEDLLFAVLQQQALLLGSREVQAAAAQAAEVAAAAAKSAAAAAEVAAVEATTQQQQQEQQQQAPLLYSDGAKGLMSVHVSVPRALGSGAAANGSSSGGSGLNGGGDQEGAATAQQLLVAFVDIKDAEALADCPVQHPSRPSAIQVLSVPPEHLQRHAEASGCQVAALPAAALVLPAGVDYDGAVQLVVEAVERQWFAELAARAGSTPGPA